MSTPLLSPIAFRTEHPLHADLLDWLREMGPATEGEVFLSFSDSPRHTGSTAVYLAIADLYEWGLLTREQTQGLWQYRLTEQGIARSVLHPAGRTP